MHFFIQRCELRKSRWGLRTCVNMFLALYLRRKFEQLLETNEDPQP